MFSSVAAASSNNQDGLQEFELDWVGLKETIV